MPCRLQRWPQQIAKSCQLVGKKGKDQSLVRDMRTKIKQYAKREGVFTLGMYSFCNDLDRENSQPEVAVVLIWHQRCNINDWIKEKSRGGIRCN